MRNNSVAAKSWNYRFNVTFEIALMGQGGLAINNPDKKYQLKSLDSEFIAMQLASYMYVGTSMIMPGQDAGIDLSPEFKAAKSLFEASIRGRLFFRDFAEIRGHRRYGGCKSLIINDKVFCG